jgi:hypothetical protein
MSCYSGCNGKNDKEMPFVSLALKHDYTDVGHMGQFVPDRQHFQH